MKRAAAGPPELVRHYLDRLAPLGTIDCRRFFGGWQFRCGGEQFAAILAGTLYLRVSGPLQAELVAAGGQPFRYSRHGREVVAAGYCSLPESCLEDDEALRHWAARALELALSRPIGGRKAVRGRG